jgi:hypothetical protein
MDMRSKGARRLILLALSIYASLFSWPVAATVPDPLLAGPPQMIVMGLSIHGKDRHSVSLIHELELQSELVKYVSSRLHDEGLDIPVTDFGHNAGIPAGIFPQNIVNLYIRADLVFIEVKSRIIVVGTISVMIRRDNDSTWAQRPFTFFATESESEVAEQARKAAIDQLEISIVEPIISQAK